MKRYASEAERLDARRAQRRAYYQRHKEAVKAYNKKYNARVQPQRKPHSKAVGWTTHLRKSYGLTLESYTAMVASQGGQCYICGPNAKSSRKKARPLCVDHNHKTGQVRKLLCDRCNRLIGCADENASILGAAAMYLMYHENIWQRG